MLKLRSSVVATLAAVAIAFFDLRSAVISSMVAPWMRARSVRAFSIVLISAMILTEAFCFATIGRSQMTLACSVVVWESVSSELEQEGDARPVCLASLVAPPRASRCPRDASLVSPRTR